MFRCYLLVTFVVVLNATPFGLQSLDFIHPQPNTPTLQWTGTHFQWPCSSTKALYKSSGKFISKNGIVTRAQIFRDEVFVALPRYKSGVPATLAKTTLKRGACHAVLVPFPCWKMQEEGNCKALQSVVDIVLDANDVLWVLDTGIVNSMETPIRKCPPKVIAFNARNGKVLKFITLDGLVSSTSRLQYLVVDYSSDGRCYIYVSDAANRAIIAYDVQASRGFRVVLPKALTQGCQRRDVLYLALVRKSCGSTLLYFTYLSSNRIFSIKTEYLRRGNAHGRVQDVGIKPSKQVIIGTDNGSAIFFRNEGQTEVYRWDTNTCFQKSNFKLVYKCPDCQLATHALVDNRRNRMRVLESNFPDFIANTVGCGAVQQLTVMQGCY